MGTPAPHGSACVVVVIGSCGTPQSKCGYVRRATRLVFHFDIRGRLRVQLAARSFIVCRQFCLFSSRAAFFVRFVFFPRRALCPFAPLRGGAFGAGGVGYFGGAAPAPPPPPLLGGRPALTLALPPPKGTPHTRRSRRAGYTLRIIISLPQPTKIISRHG